MRDSPKENEQQIIQLLIKCKVLSEHLPNKTLGKVIYAQLANMITQITGNHESKVSVEDIEKINNAIRMAGSKSELARQLGVKSDTIRTWTLGINKPQNACMQAVHCYLAGARKDKYK